MALTADGKCAVSASADRTLKVWDLETGRVLRTLESHSHSVLSVALTAHGKRAVSGSEDRTLKVWDLESGRALASFECDAPVACCACHLTLVVAGDDGGQIHFLQFEEDNQQIA